MLRGGGVERDCIWYIYIYIYTCQTTRLENAGSDFFGVIFFYLFFKPKKYFIGQKRVCFSSSG